MKKKNYNNKSQFNSFKEKYKDKTNNNKNNSYTNNNNNCNNNSNTNNNIIMVILHGRVGSHYITKQNVSWITVAIFEHDVSVSHPAVIYLVIFFQSSNLSRKSSTAGG